MNLQKFFRGKKVLVTGHTGFKGSWLCQVLILWGAEVVGIGLKPNTSPNIYSILKLDKKMKSHISDVRDYKKIKAIFDKEKPEIVFHLAAQPIVRESYDNPIYTFETNILGTANILEAIRFTSSVKSVVMITTDKVYEDMKTSRLYKESDRLGGYDPYSSSKACAELVIASYIKSFFNPLQYGKSHKTLVASARAGNMIGGGDWSKDRIIPDFVRAVFEKKLPLGVRSPKAVRPWQHVLEPLYGYMLIAKKLYGGEKNYSEPWNLGPNQKNHITVDKVLSIAINKLNKGSFVISPDYIKHETHFLGLDSSKARKKLDWNGILSVNRSIEWTIDWYKNYYGKRDIIKFTKDQINSYFKDVL